VTEIAGRVAIDRHFCRAHSPHKLELPHELEYSSPLFSLTELESSALQRLATAFQGIYRGVMGDVPPGSKPEVIYPVFIT
jgi:hypothetical protein